MGDEKDEFEPVNMKFNPMNIKFQNVNSAV